MADEIVVKVEGEESAAEVAEQTADAVIEAAVEIAEKIDEARQEGDASAEELREVKYTLDDLWGGVAALNERIGILTDLVMGISDQVAGLAAIEVAEIVETESESKVEDIAETAEDIADATPPNEVVEEAVTPQVRKSKVRRWI